MEAVRLLLTVSGGLEDLAEEQLRACFRNQLLELKWHKKPSGSQLYITLPMHESIVTEIARAMRRLDYIEYVYALLESFQVSHDRDEKYFLLQEIEKATSDTKQSSIDFCKSVCESVTSMLSGGDAGLKGLPGILLPTLEVQSSSSLPKVSCEEFDVNTIYTKPNVAHAIIQTIADFCKQQNHDRYNSTENILWLDAGAGNGSLLEHMPPQNSIGIDTHPTSPRVRQLDFLELSKSWLESEFPDHSALFVVSNPPFSISSRGDYTPIVTFINHSLDVLEADIVAIMCPSKFARERIWKSLGMTESATLLARFFLPSNSFFNPYSGKEVHIHSYCLIFGRRECSTVKNDTTIDVKSGVYLSAKRDKGLFPDLTTADLGKAVAAGFTNAGMECVPERTAKYMLNAKLAHTSILELWWHINPQLPCSLVNSNSMMVPNHSLGWISMSVKPPVALAMASMSLNGEYRKSRLAINLMSGEGTIELEASRAVEHSFFLISGDKSHMNVLKTARRVQTLQSHSYHRPIVDVVVWDAQNLPLRKGIADAIFADLPIQGSLKKVHQEPKARNAQSTESSSLSQLSYPRVLAEASRVLKAKGRATLLSPDFKSLRHASSCLNWRLIGYSMSVNLGGLNGSMHQRFEHVGSMHQRFEHVGSTCERSQLLDICCSNCSL